MHQILFRIEEFRTSQLSARSLSWNFEVWEGKKRNGGEREKYVRGRNEGRERKEKEEREREDRKKGKVRQR